MENEYFSLPFYVWRNSIHMSKEIRGKEVEVKLCNFAARIVEDITRTDGVENERFLSIIGNDESGNPLRKITVPLKNFAQLDWAQEQWGMNCIVEAGYGNRDSLRQAIQSTAKYAETKTIYGTTGWWETADGWRFCMPGNSESEVELTEKTKGFSFKTDSDVTETISVMKNFPYSVAPKSIMFPMLAYTFGSILNTFMSKAGKEAKTVIMLYGKTGSMKTTLALLINSLFGRFNEDNIPMNFRDTPKSILNYCFTLKDCAVVIDDYHPGSNREQSAQDSTTQALIRGICNREARGALDKNGKQRAAKRPQCNVIMTAEYLPNVGESGVIRLALSQQSLTETEQPTEIFLRKLRSLIDVGKVNLINRMIKVCEKPRNLIGYYDDENYYFESDEAYAAVVKSCNEVGEHFPLTQKALVKALKNEGVSICSKGECTRNVRVFGIPKRLLCISNETFNKNLPPEEETNSDFEELPFGPGEIWV